MTPDDGISTMSSYWTTDAVFRVGLASASDCPCSLVAECQVNMQVPGAQSSQMATSLDADLRLSDGASLMHGRVPAEVQNTVGAFLAARSFRHRDAIDTSRSSMVNV